MFVILRSSILSKLLPNLRLLDNEYHIRYNRTMSKRSVFFLSGIGIFFLFVLFSYLVHRDLFTTFDFNATVHLQDNISRRFDGIFSFLSDIGKFEVMTIVLIGIFVITRKWLAGGVALALYGGFHLFELFGKYFVNHPPPAQFMLRTQQVLNFPQFHVRSEFSYPSGHSGRALFITVILLVLLWNSKRMHLSAKVALTCLLVGYDIAMLTSRVVLGEHWTTDVIGGSLLGMALGLLAGGFLVGKGKIKNLGHTSLFPKYKIEIKKVE
jgi:membrane-associated phospholipid phosphatase